MASTYSPLLRIQLMGTGDQANTWGITTNINLAAIVEQAIAGAAAITVPNTNITLSANDGAYDQSREMILLVTGALTQARTIFVPSVSKVYVVKNATTGGFPILIQTTAVGNAVSVPNGKTAFVYSDGTDFDNVVQSLTNAAITGGTISGLDTPIAVADGGTGGATAEAARVALGAAASGVNNDITGLAGLLTPIAVTQGGTGANNINSARTNLEAAKSGNNSDITSLAGLTTPLSPTQGGTGASSIGSAGAIMYSNGTNQVASNAPTVGQIPIANGSGVVSFQNQVASIVYVIDGGGAIYSNGVKGFLQIPFNCTITAVSLLADQTGSTVIDIWKDTYANFPPTGADSITGAAKPTITASNKSVNSTLTGWTTTITAGDVLAFNVDSVTTITRVTITLSVNRI
jgi:hypothetical protein